MPRSSGTAVENSFVKGLLTEATGLNFPENACTETWNCVFEQTGKVRRRLGFDLETDHEFVSITNHEHAVVNYLWRAVAQNGTFDFVVQQTGPIIRFYKTDTLTSLSASEASFTVDLDDHLSGGAAVTTRPAQFASGHGKLFVTHRQCEPLAIIYDEVLDTITVTEIEIQIRDFDGVDDSLLDDEQPGTLSDTHKYNLYNQGWYNNQTCATGTSLSSTTWAIMSPITRWFQVYSNYPANNMTWWTFKRPQLIHSNGSSQEAFDPRLSTTITLSNTRAPRGHYLYNAFYIDRSAVSGVSGLDIETSGTERPSACEFFTGRVFYAGVSSRKHSSKIYFTQIIESDRQLGRCYQVQDPTDETAPDLLPSDGGVIIIPGLAEVIKLVAKGSVLFVFATNGVWQIAGSEGTGFRANDYSVTKITDTPALSPHSFVLVDGNPIWANRTGIWTLVPNQVGTAYDVQSLTDQTIKTFYQAIPDDRKAQIVGTFDRKERLIYWLYSDDDSLASNTYNKVLLLNTITGAFYPWVIENDAVLIKGLVNVTGHTTVETITEVEVGSDSVDSNGQSVIIFTSERRPAASYTVWSVFVPDEGMTFSELSDTSFTDWAAIAGEPFDSWLISGYRVHGEGNKDFQSNYVTVHYEPTIDGSAKIQGQWDYATSGDTGRWSTHQEIYRLATNNYDYQSAKLKIRGHGKSLQFRIKSIDEKPFILTGWTVFVTGNSMT